MLLSTNATATTSSTVTSIIPVRTPAYGYLILLFIPVLTILGNILVILAVLGDKQLKKSVTNRYIAALAFSDFLVGVIPMPLAVYVKVNGEKWNLGVGMCKFYVACDVTSSTASILHLVVISADRYLAISWPAEYQRYARKAKITFAIVLVWLISITLSIPVVLGKSILDTESCWLANPEYMIYSSLLSFYIPAGVLMVVYVKIFRKIRIRQGIHSMLRTGGGGCGPDVPTFHLPFVVVQEVSFDDQPSSTDKRPSDTLSPSLALTYINQPATTFPVELSPPPDDVTGSAVDRLGMDDSEETPVAYEYETVENKLTKSVAKSKTFPTAFAEETETILSLKECNGQTKKPTNERRLLCTRLKLSNRSNTANVLEFGHPQSAVTNRRKKSETKRVDNGRLLSRTSSEKGRNEVKDRAVQTRPRRFSLWYHHSCQHVGASVPNGNCFVLSDEEKEEESDEADFNVGRRPSESLGTRLISSKRKPKNKFRCQKRRASSFDQRQRMLSLAEGENLTTDPSEVVSASTSMDFGPVQFDSPNGIASPLTGDEEEEDEETPACSMPGSFSKTKAGFRLKKLANRVTSALHRITETQVVTKEKKATKLVALILGVFVISWLPFFTFNSLRGLCLSAISSTTGCDWLSSHLFFATSWLGYANSSFNPIIYALVNQRFRATYKRLLGWPLTRHS